MANRKVTLVRLCKTEQGWRRYPVVLGKNGRVRPGFVTVAGQERHYPVGKYQLRTYDGDKMVYRDAGDEPTIPSEASAAKEKAETFLAAKAEAAKAGIRLQVDGERQNLRRALTEFLQDTRDRGSMEAAAVYETAADEFLTITGRNYADEITSADISKHQGQLRKRGLADRTVANRHHRVMAFLRYLKLDTKDLAKSKPRYEKSLPETYTDEELRTLFDRTTDPRLSLVFELLLKTGMREQEAMYLTWTSIDFERGVLRVRSNPDHGFKVKDKEQRDIPVPPDLLSKLRTHRDTHGGKLVTGTANDQPNTKLLRTLKRAVKDADLNCGRCDSCYGRKECERWFLHKFRATYVTKLLRSGMDLRTVMKLSGHSDLDSVMRYLSPASDEAIQQHLSQMKWM